MDRDRGRRPLARWTAIAVLFFLLPAEASAYNVWFSKEEDDLWYVFNQLPVSSPYYEWDESMAARWNLYCDVFRVFSASFVPLFNNDRSDQAGLLSDAGYNNYFGASGGWGGGAAVAAREVLAPFVYSDQFIDIAYNSNVNWTTNPQSFGMLFQASALHELGHALGLDHNFYDMSAMNYFQPSLIDDHLMPDDVRYLYDTFPSFSKLVTDMGVWAYHASGYRSFTAATVSPSQVTAGNLIEVDGIYVGNLRNGTQANAEVHFYLSTNTTITPSDEHIATLTFTGSWPRAVGGIYDDLVMTVPASLAEGYYYVGMIVQANGTSEDSITYNNRAVLPSPVYVGANTKSLTVTRTGSGSGTVTSSPSGINCGSECSHAYAPGTTVTLTATAASGSMFSGWSGACSGTGSCQVTMTSNRSVTATFSASTAASCAVKTIANTSIGTSAAFAACDRVTAGPDVTIGSAGDVSLHGGRVVSLRSGFRVLAGGSLVVTSCGQNLCTEGPNQTPLVSGCHPCVSQICASDPYCCESEWDGLCVDEVETICGLTC